MNAQHLREYLVLVDELCYSTAARKLYISRPTLKTHLKELEEELGCLLVERRTEQIALTMAGRRFVQRAADLLAHIDEVIAEFQTLSQNLITVTIASTNLPWLESTLYKARQNIRKRYSQKQIEIVSVNGPLSTLSALSEAHNDIVVTGYKSYLAEHERPILPKGMQSFWLQREEIKFLMTQENPLCTRVEVRARDLDGHTLIVPPDLYEAYARDGVCERLAAQGAKVQLELADVDDHFEYFNYDFEEKIGIVPTTLIPRFGIDEREEYCTFSLLDFPLYTDFFAVYNEEFAATEGGGLLIEEMKAIIQER
ncbi:MAG: LysR family transcriptional regulator [Coriobacteriales bacterium]|jgi:DNA-binding transcriptional LysR family regulator|nr:LysR family transcriptional regulator [Coriobacteriales bacterium]